MLAFPGGDSSLRAGVQMPVNLAYVTVETLRSQLQIVPFFHTVATQRARFPSNEVTVTNHRLVGREFPTSDRPKLAAERKDRFLKLIGPLKRRHLQMHEFGGREKRHDPQDEWPTAD